MVATASRNAIAAKATRSRNGLGSIKVTATNTTTNATAAAIVSALASPVVSLLIALISGIAMNTSQSSMRNRPIGVRPR